MDPKQALSILDNAAAAAPLTRAEHVAVQRAIAALTALVESAVQVQPNPDPAARPPQD